jgi:hypothetical protein
MKRTVGLWRQTACAISLIGLAGSALAWGAEGHKTVAAIAAEQLKGTATEARVKGLLHASETLLDASVWADCAKGFIYCHKQPTPEMQDFAAGNPDHHGYHYTDVPIQALEYTAGSVGTTDHDVVQTIKQAVFGLQGDTSDARNPHHFTPRQSLMILAHMVGDIHQPLHVGAAYLDLDGRPVMPTEDDMKQTGTEGGNFLFIGGKSRVLHGYWDSDAVKTLMRRKQAKTPQALAKALLADDDTPVVLEGDLDSIVIAWANESLAAARTAFEGVVISEHRTNFKDSQGDLAAGWAVTLPQDYTKTSSDVASGRLLSAGKRLAAILRLALE